MKPYKKACVRLAFDATNYQVTGSKFGNNSVLATHRLKMVQAGQVFLPTFTSNTTSITDAREWFNLLYYYHTKEGLIKVDKEFVKKKPVPTTGSIQNKIQIPSLASHIAHQWILDQLPGWKEIQSQLQLCYKSEILNTPTKKKKHQQSAWSKCMQYAVQEYISQDPHGLLQEWENTPNFDYLREQGEIRIKLMKMKAKQILYEKYSEMWKQAELEKKSTVTAKKQQEREEFKLLQQDDAMIKQKVEHKRLDKNFEEKWSALLSEYNKEKQELEERKEKEKKDLKDQLQIKYQIPAVTESNSSKIPSDYLFDLQGEELENYKESLKFKFQLEEEEDDDVIEVSSGDDIPEIKVTPPRSAKNKRWKKNYQEEPPRKVQKIIEFEDSNDMEEGKDNLEVVSDSELPSEAKKQLGDTWESWCSRMRQVLITREENKKDSSTLDSFVNSFWEEW
jgi:hypothetical protein